MKWYGFAAIFIISLFFCNLLYSVRLRYTEQNAFIEKTFPLPETDLKILNRPNAVFSAKNIPKQPLILFFFASWCKPCLYETPVIKKLSERKDVPFIGVAVRDDEKKLEAFLNKFENPFQYVALDPEMDWTEAMHARTLPTAFILNHKGEVVAKINHIITEDFYFKTILPFLQELKRATPL